VPVPLIEPSALRSNDNVRAIWDLVGQITQKYDRAYYRKCVAEQRYPEELWDALGEAGLLGLGLPEDWGGEGGGILEECAVVEALGRAGILAFSLVIGQLARIPVFSHGDGEAARRFVAATLRGERRPCFGLTEPDAGTNAFAMRTVARRDPDRGGWRVSGQKLYISGADAAEQMLLIARTNDRADKAEFILLLVDMSSEGLTIANQPIDIVAPCKQATIFLDEVFVPDDNVVGDPGRGARYLFTSLNHERIMASAMALGLAEHVLNKGVEYAGVRAPFGEPIGGYQATQHPLARCKIRLETGRLMMYEAALAFDQGREADTMAAMAKWVSSEAAWETLDTVVQAHGGYAFDGAADLMQFMGFLRMLRIAPLNNEMVLNYVGERVLGLPRTY
jgi:acyl-CoA dehydrogenase